MASVHISKPSIEECINLDDSYGMICVGCNACGRINPKTQKEDALKMWKQKLQEALEFDQWDPDNDELQRRNIERNIQHYKEKIAELERGA